jgi:large conductance mechanosensitive channel
MERVISEFKEFILRGNVLELAVAVVIGAAFKTVVDSLVADIIMPIVAMLFGEPNFSGLDFTINDAVFRYGAFITNVISFLIIAAAIFFIVVLPYNRLKARMARGEEPDAEAPEDIVLLRDIRDSLRARG